MSKSKNIEYNKNILSIINDISIINSSFIINKVDDKLLIKQTNAGTTLAYRFVTSAKNFNFDGKELAFSDYQEFYQLFSCLENPTLTETENKLIISKDKTKIDYILTDPEQVGTGPKKIAFKDPTTIFNISVSELKEIEKMIGLLQAESVNFSCTEGSDHISVKLFNNGHDNSFTKEYNTEKASNCDKNIASEIFTYIPKGDYKIEITDAGIMRFTLVSKDPESKFLLELFTAELEDEE